MDRSPAAVAAAFTAAVLSIAACGGSAAPVHTSTTPASTARLAPATAVATATPPSTPRTKPAPRPPYRVAERVVTFVDSSRARRLVTVVRYPKASRPSPLIVFGHGFAVTPAPYAALLTAWASAGYVVAAPVFPLGNANAPGGPNEADLVNQPRDMSFVITRMLSASASRSGFLAGTIDPHEVAVSGQSDGGDTALAVAYDPRFRDRRIDAAVILSGAEIPFLSSFAFGSGPPLLATQGTADTINPPELTYNFFDAAPAPKYLVRLLGAPHLGPYTDEQPQLGVVERLTILFLDAYLKRQPGALRRMAAAARVPGTAMIQADPPIR